MWMQAHDDPLQVLVEWGPVGLVAVVVIYAGPLVSGWRWRTRVADDDRHLVLAGATALLVTGAHALIDFPLRVLPNQLAAIVCGAVVLGACRAERVAEG
jgi:O-antigen ligase